MQILVICRRQAFEHRQNGHQAAHQAPRFATGQLERVGVLLLGHQTRSGRVGVGQRHKAVLGTTVEHHILGQATNVDTDHRRYKEVFGDEIAVTDGVDAVATDIVHAQVSRQCSPIDLERRAGDSARSERQHGHPLQTICQPLAVALQRPEVREQPVPQQDGLGTLHMGVARDNQITRGVSLHQNGTLDLAHALVGTGDSRHHPQTDVGGDLVVATATGVEFASHRTDDLSKPTFNRRVNVFVGSFGGERSRRKFIRDHLQAAQQFVSFGRCYHPGSTDLAGPGHTATDVFGPHGTVKRE